MYPIKLFVVVISYIFCNVSVSTMLLFFCGIIKSWLCILHCFLPAFNYVINNNNYSEYFGYKYRIRYYRYIVRYLKQRL